MRYILLITFTTLFLNCSETSFPEPQLNDDLARSKASIGIVGDKTDTTTQTEPGLVLMGGSTDVDEAIKWMIERSGGGDFVVIRVTGADAYNQYIFDLDSLNSVETLKINSSELINDSLVIESIRQAEALFIAGGDQYDYVSLWKDTPVEDAINYLRNIKKVPIGGTSAGMAIMGEIIFDAENGTVRSELALKEPFNDLVSLQKGDFLKNSFLNNTITDTHYDDPDRKGRHIVFMARSITDWNLTSVYGIGADERTAVCIDSTGRAYVFGEGDAYFHASNGNTPEVLSSDEPLHWYQDKEAIKTYKVQGSDTGAGYFDLSDWSTGENGTWLYYYVENGTLQLKN